MIQVTTFSIKNTFHEYYALFYSSHPHKLRLIPEMSISANLNAKHISYFLREPVIGQF